jgi:hypothetical protein
MNIERIMASLEAKHPGESEYLQAVKEVLLSIEDIYNQHPEFEKAKIIERLVEPDRIFTFRVTWVDDKGEVQTNLGYRVQFNNAIGPYKGGIRFHASVNLSILKFQVIMIRMSLPILLRPFPKCAKLWNVIYVKKDMKLKRLHSQYKHPL